MKILTKHYYQSTFTWLTLLLWPLSLLFRFIVFLRKYAYKIRLLKTYRASVPVIVVGNLTVGGTGKTPCVIALAKMLQAEGRRVGIVSRGYPTRHDQPLLLQASTTPKMAGDEPVLIFQKIQCPVVVCRQRVLAVKMLEQMGCDVIVSDDALQHYALERDLEIVMIDPIRRWGNQQCLPAGPLREPLSRLSEGVYSFTLTLTPERFYPLNNFNTSIELSVLKEKTIHAVAGIGHPERFFDTLRQSGLDIIPHAFPDHYLFQAKDICFKDQYYIVMTEKDGIKCQAFADDRHVCLSVVAQLPEDLRNLVHEKISAYSM